MAYEGLKDNKNAEKYDLKKANELFDKSIKLAINDGHDFMGTVAVKLGVYMRLYDHLISRFPELKEKFLYLKQICESNCYEDGKKGDIVPSLAIMNLKSNHGWTDRIDNTSKGNEIKSIDPITWVDNAED